MNTNLGYSKRTLTNTDVLLSGGGNKPLSEFIGSISWDATNRKIKYTPVGGTVTDLVTLSSLAITNYLLPAAKTNALGGIIVSNALTTAVTLTSGNGTTANRYYGIQIDKDGKAFVNIPWTNTWNQNTATLAGYVTAPGKNQNGKVWMTGSDGTPSWLNANNHTHNYITSLGNKDASNLPSTYPNGLSIAGIYSNGYPFTYGSTITAKGNGGNFQIAGQWNSAVSSLTDYDYPTEMYIRGRRDSYDVWTTWTRVLTDRNWSSVITLPTKDSWNYDDMYVSSLTTNGNSLRWVKNGSNNDITIPYATSSGNVGGLAAKKFNIGGTGSSNVHHYYLIISFTSTGLYSSWTIKLHIMSRTEGGEAQDYYVLIGGEYSSNTSKLNGVTAYTLDNYLISGDHWYYNTSNGVTNVYFYLRETWKEYTCTVVDYRNAAFTVSNIKLEDTPDGLVAFSHRLNITSANISSQSVNYANSAGSVVWDNISEKPSTFTPSSHTHDYLPLSGGTLSNNGYAEQLTINRSNGKGNAVINYNNKTDGLLGRIGITGSGDPLGKGHPIFHNGTTNYKLYHEGNIPSNSSSAKGVVPAGVASSVYMTDANKNPSWTSIDSAVTSGSSNLVTSGAVFTAIANKVAGAVQYLGTITSEAEMKALSTAGYGDFARIATSFSFTDASGESVTAHVGDVVYLISNEANAYATSSNWVVAHTEIDTNTWTAASTSASGYIPKLVTGGTNLETPSTDYVLAYVNGNATPVWRKLPSNAYANTQYYLTLNGTVNGTSGKTNLGTIYAPTTSGTGFLKSSVSNNTVTWSYDNTSYLPLIGGTMTGRIIRNSGSLWVKARENAIINNTTGNGNIYCPAFSMKTDNGDWSIGSHPLSNRLCAIYNTDEHYNNGNNLPISIDFPKTSGTLALTSLIPTKASWNYDDVYVKSVSISGNNLRINKNGANTDLTIPYATSAGNADTVDNWHQSNLVWSGYVTSETANLSSYWFKAWECTITNHRYNDLDLMLLVSSAYNARRGLVHIRIRQNGENNGGAYNFGMGLWLVIGNIPLDDMRLYCNNSSGICQLWMNVVGQHGVYNYTVIKKTWRTGIDITSFGTLTASYFTTAQTVPALSNGTCIQLSNGSSIAWGSVASKPETATRWPAWSEVTGKPSTFTPSDHTHNYLPLSGGTIASGDFGVFNIQRNHTTNAAAIGFKHYSTGTTVETMGYIGMHTKDGTLRRWNAAANTEYTILDSSNSSVSKNGETLTVKINGTTKSLTNTNTTYSAGTAELLSAGTDTTDRVWKAKIIKDEMKKYISTSGNQTLNGILTIAPSNSSAYQDALILYDSGGGGNEGARIRFTSASYTTGITLGPNSDKSNLMLNNAYALIHTGNISSYFKTINGNSIIGTGNITIESGSAIKLYTSHLLTKRDLWFRFANLTRYGASYLVSIRDNYYNNSPTPVTWIINVGHASATITLIGKVVLTPTSLTKFRIVRYSINSDFGFHLEVYTPYQSYISQNTPEINIINLGRNDMTDGIELVHDPNYNTKWLEVNKNIQSNETLIEEADIPKTATLWGQSFDGVSAVSGSISSNYFKLIDSSTNPYLQFINGSTNWYLQYYNNAMYMGAGVANSMGINSSGNVGIGTTPSSSYKLYVNGNTSATNFYTTSDRNKKKNISEFSEHIRKFQLKDTEKWSYGVIAQEVEEMFREGEDGNMTVNYDSVLSYYIGLLENKVKALEEKIRILETKNK